MANSASTAPRACTPEPIRLQRHATNTPATAAEAADRGAATFTAAPIRRTIAARLNPAEPRAGHDHTTRTSSCPVVAAGSNPAQHRPGHSHAARAIHPPRHRRRIEPGPSTRRAAAAQPEVYSCPVAADCPKSARRPVGSGRWEVDRERRR
jgi:hypothetical protein